MKKFSYFLVLSVVLFQTGSAQKDISAISIKIRQQIFEEISEQELLKNTVAYLPLIKGDGSWPDIDYTNTAITKWPPGQHLERVKSLAVAFVKEGSVYNTNSSVWDAVVKALSFWYRANPKSQNWWHNEIATPQSLGEIMLLMQSATRPLPADLQHNLVQRMKQGNVFEKTGANKLDIALHIIYRACITNDAALMDTAVSQAFYPIAYTTGEGLQYDYSYLQHGAQLQISSYGLVFLSGEYKVASWMQGTAYALKGEQLKLLNQYFLHSFLPAIRGRYIDFNTEGRGISRKDILDKAGLAVPGKINSLLEMAKAVSPENAALIDAAMQRISQQQLPGYGLISKHTHFWKADYTQHIRPAYSFNVRTVSDRTKRTETGNKENLSGKFLADGSTNIQRSGKEYFNIMPLWEWDKIPGITARDFADDQLTTVQWGETGSTGFVGGVSDNLFGASCYEMNYNGVSVKKAWFFFDKEVVCLGAGISSNADENIITSINQSWLNGKIVASENDKTVSIKKENNYAALQWLWHDSIGYYFPSPQNITVTNKTQTGSWFKINGSGLKETTEGKVFKLWLNHGVKPADSSYSYIVVPGVSTDEMAKYKRDEISIIVNTDSVQAVQHCGLKQLQIVFYKAGTVTGKDMKVKADKPCVILLSLSANTITVADPYQKSSELVVTIKKQDAEKKIICQLPGGNFSGSSVSFKIE